MSTELVLSTGTPVVLPEGPAPSELLAVGRHVAVHGIQSQAQADGCVKMLSVIKELTDTINASFDPAVKAAHDAHKKIIAARDEHTDVLEEAEKLLRAALNRWVVAQKQSGVAVPMEGVTTRTTWKYTVEDLASVPREYLMLDEKKIKAVVKAMKGETAIPGIRVHEEGSVAVKKAAEEW